MKSPVLMKHMFKLFQILCLCGYLGNVVMEGHTVLDGEGKSVILCM